MRVDRFRLCRAAAVVDHFGESRRHERAARHNQARREHGCPEEFLHFTHSHFFLVGAEPTLGDYHHRIIQSNTDSVAKGTFSDLSAR